MAEQQNFTFEQVKELLQIAQKHDPASATLTGTPLNGPFPGNNNQFGIFSTPGVRPGRFSANQRTRSIGSILPLVRSEYFNEKLEIMTGVTDGTGNNASGFCGDPPAYGQLKTMQIVSVFGEIHFKTQLNDLTQAGLLRDRADVSGQLYNDAAVTNPWLPQVPGVTGITDSRSLVQSELFAAGNGLERVVAQVNWRGVAGTADNTYRGIQKQWNGFDQLIKTGYTDAVTGVAAPAADSIVASFNTLITGTDANGLDFVEAAHNVYWALKDRASRVGMDGTTWAIVMRSEHFRVATEVWACAYATYRCNDLGAGLPLDRDGMQTQALRIQMMQGQYLLFDGEQVPVIFDDGILRETTANNTYKSDMYWIPLNWNGFPLTYAQYFPMDNYVASEWANFAANETITLNNGLYRVAKRSTGFCIEYLFGSRVRLILETPFLSGRLDDAQYVYLAQTRDSIPGQSLYVNGGSTYRA